MSLSVEKASIEECELPWYALYVKHRHEKKVARSLSGKAVHSFVPTFSKTHRNGSQFDLPLFPGYVFCRLDISTTLPVVSTPGVFGIVSSGTVPGAIPEEEIEAVRQLLSSGLPLQPTPYFAEGQEVAFNSGPLRGVHGQVLDASDDRWLVVSINMLKRSVAVKLDRQAVLSLS
jgi:transcription antitermination factor NusG